VHRVIVRADGVQGVVPLGEQLASLRVEVAAPDLVPHRQVIGIEAHFVGRWPPDLVEVAAMICRSSARETVPRMAICTCGASRFCGSMVAKYCTS
jgi:hypothetical protein